jgi:hypothetical protein
MLSSKSELCKLRIMSNAGQYERRLTANEGFEREKLDQYLLILQRKFNQLEAATRVAQQAGVFHALGNVLKEWMGRGEQHR